MDFNFHTGVRRIGLKIMATFGTGKAKKRYVFYQKDTDKIQRDLYGNGRSK